MFFVHGIYTKPTIFSTAFFDPRQLFFGLQHALNITVD